MLEAQDRHNSLIITHSLCWGATTERQTDTILSLMTSNETNNRLSLTSALGQNFIFLTIQLFDALVLTTVTTTRKFFTILLSVSALFFMCDWGAVCASPCVYVCAYVWW